MDSIAPALIHQESEIIKRTLRDMYDETTQNIIGVGLIIVILLFLLSIFGSYSKKEKTRIRQINVIVIK